jgi:signal transduction histidine kinase
MSNVVAHSGAKNVTVVLSMKNREFCLQISDDGRGFDVESKMRSRSHSFGLRAIKSRIELLGGVVEFKSTRVGYGGEYQGTTIRVCVPANDVEADEGTRDSPGL